MIKDFKTLNNYPDV